MHPVTTTEENRFFLDNSIITIGRDESCSVRLEGVGVSRLHAQIELHGDGPIVTDLNSTFGVQIDDCSLRQGILRTDSILTIGVIKFRISIEDSYLILTPFSSHSIQSENDTKSLKENYRIGRDSQNDLQLKHPLVSQFHACVHTSANKLFYITDLHSTNGTYVNGHPAGHRTSLSEGDIVQIGPYRLFFENGNLRKINHRNRIQLEAYNVTVKRKYVTLLDSISVSIAPGEFVAILGPSGAGKTTLARTLTGHQVLESGEIYANGLPFRQYLGAFSSNIGYVTQHNILHESLTVAETFREQCLIRLPRDSIKEEREKRIQEVVSLLDLGKVINRRIDGLSGGEAKRVHLGIELLASPALIFLDEPLAGLDPGLIRKFMRLFRQICDRGHTLILTTHTLEQIELCDRLLFMSEGKIIYQGSPSGLGTAFGEQSLAGVYEKIRSGPHQAIHPGVFKKTFSINEFKKHQKIPSVPLRKAKTIAFHKQIVMLLKRYGRMLWRDRRNGLLLLLQAPLIALLLGFVFGIDTNFFPMSFYFCVTIASVWIGGINAIKEIAREWHLIEREFRIGLSIYAYLIARMTVSSFLGVVQGALFALSIQLLFYNMPFSGAFWILLLVATIFGVLLGLTISAWSSHVGIAIAILPIVFIPQIFFSGIMTPFDRMHVVGRFLSHCTISRPIFGMFKKVCLLNQSLLGLNEWHALFLLWVGLIILMIAALKNKNWRGK